MQTTYYAAKAIEDHEFGAARRRPPQRLHRTVTARSDRRAWALRAGRPVANPS